MLLLIAVAFVAGIVTALSPCVLPVLPVILAGGTGRERAAALRRHRRARRRASPSSRWPRPRCSRRSACRTTCCGTSRSSSSRSSGSRSSGRGSGICSSGRSRARPPRAGRRRRRVPARALPRARLHAVRRTGDRRRRDRRGDQSVSFDAVSSRSPTRSGRASCCSASPWPDAAASSCRASAARRRRSAGPRRRRARRRGAMALGVDTELRTQRARVHAGAPDARETSDSTADRIDGLLGRARARRRPRREGGEELEDFGPAPDFAGIDGWLNSAPLTMEELRGKVVLLDFWTYSCINCLRTLPYLKRWDEAYRDKGLVIVGVHTPEFAFERERSNVEGAVERLGLSTRSRSTPTTGPGRRGGTATGRPSTSSTARATSASRTSARATTRRASASSASSSPSPASRAGVGRGASADGRDGRRRPRRTSATAGSSASPAAREAGRGGRVPVPGLPAGHWARLLGPLARRGGADRRRARRPPPAGLPRAERQPRARDRRPNRARSRSTSTASAGAASRWSATTSTRSRLCPARPRRTCWSSASRPARRPTPSRSGSRSAGGWRQVPLGD